MNKRYKIIIILSIIVVSLGVIYTISGNKKTTENNQGGADFLTTGQTPSVTPQPEITTAPILQSPNNIEWKVIVPEIQTQPVSYRWEKIKVDKVYSENLAKKLDGFGVTTSIPNRQVYYSNNNTNNNSLMVDGDKGVLTFSKNLLINNPTLTSITRGTNQTILNKSLVLLNSLLPLSDGLKYERDSITYLNYGNPNFIPSTEADGDYIFITYNWSYQTSKVWQPDMAAATIIYRRDGLLIQLSVLLPPTQLLESKSEVLNSSKEVMESKPIILTTSGRKNYSDFEIKLDKITITSVNSGLFYRPETGLMTPAILALGNSILPDGPITLTLAFPLVKQ